jgi:hypothetical protein
VNYEDFFKPADVRIFKRVKRGQMRLARVIRGVLAEMTGGHIAAKGPEFLLTGKGKWAIRMSANSDNSLEQWAHDNAGARTVIIENDGELWEFFRTHGMDPTESMAVFKTLVYSRLMGP